MLKRPWTLEETTWLRQHYPKRPRKQVTELFANHFGYTRGFASITLKARMLGLVTEPHAVTASLLSRPQTQRKLAWDAIPRYTAFERLTGEYAICSDLHVPKVDPTMVNHFCQTAKRFGLTRCMILGDFFDQNAFSHWVQVGLQPADVPFGDEIVYAAQVFETLLGQFNHIACMRGNHDDRILRLLRFSLELRDVYAMVGKRVAERLQAHLAQALVVSEYPFCHLNETWFCAHPNTYSKIPGSVARDVAETEGMSTIMGNGHLLSMSRDKSDRYWAVDSGCLVDPLKVYYKVFTVKRFPRWQQGFVILKQNLPMVFHRAHLEGGWP